MTSLQSHQQLRDEHWQDRAACRGPQVATFFFPPVTPERKDERLMRESYAKSICNGCHVREDCLGYAISIREPHGVWGGLNEVERRRLYAN
ncbi:MAG: WhiB family transcriptional regulator [Acidimicrobiales bacterium]|nr:WhiB family transcriptional regulator [Acidimicrobiales bacterium]